MTTKLKSSNLTGIDGLNVAGDVVVTGPNRLVGCYGGSGVTSNVAIGASTLISNTTGYNTTAIGQSALYANTTGYNTTAIGMQALYSNTTGYDNTAIGQSALYYNTTGFKNTANGKTALVLNTTGYYNTAIGMNALYSNTTGYYNTANGVNALYSNTTGYDNTANGVNALYSNTTGYYNTAVGVQALYYTTTGICNTGLGVNGLVNCTTGSGNISIGEVNGSGGHAPAYNITTQNNLISMGTYSTTNAYIAVAWTVVSDSRDKMNFNSVPHGWAFVKQLNPISYQFRTDRSSNTSNGPVRYGFKAQDILALEGNNPVIIDTSDEDRLRYNGESLVPVLVNALKEAMTRIESLEAQVNQLKGA